jgi:hypothetical protein
MTPNNSPADATATLNKILNMTAPTSVGPSGARGIFSSILGGIGNLAFPGLGTIIGNAIGGSALGGAMPILGGQTTQYLQLQQQIENESIAFEMASNVLKVRHDSASKAIDNFK